MYDLLIIGGGPAGVSAGIYAARKRLKTSLVTYDFGGQSVVSSGIQNWIGFVEISGEELAKKLKEHLNAYKSDVVDVTEGEKIVLIESKGDYYVATTDTGRVIETKSVLCTSGSNRKKLPVLNADKFEHKGLTYCATCDGPMFGDQDVVVVGGGNSAFESAVQLSEYAKSVTILQRSKDYRADPVTVEGVLKNPKINGITGVEFLSINGDKFVDGISIKVDGEVKTIPCTGIFVEIGHIPSTEFLDGIVDKNEMGEIIIDAKTQKTSAKNVWAAGDCTDVLYRQNGIAVGDAIKAIEDLYKELKK